MLLNRFYYTVKPWMPDRMRLALRRLHARRILRRSAGVWPILESAGRKPEGWPGWPDGKQFALVLTHDVESQRGLDNVKPLAELEMSLGFRSAFYFIPEGPYTVPAALRAWLTDHGFEVGVHDLHHDGKLYRNRKHFRRCADKINRYLEDWNAVGFRSAFMHHNLDWIRDLNIQYDSSTFDTDPFEPQPDGVGTIFPFWVSAGNVCRGQRSEVGSQRSGARVQGSAVRDQRSDILTPDTLTPDSSLLPAPSGYLELPYTLPQDSTLFGVLSHTSIDTWQQKLDWIAQQGGMALLNTHPDYMAFGDRISMERASMQHYYEFLAVAREKYGTRLWCRLPATVACKIEIKEEVPQTLTVRAGGTSPGSLSGNLAGKRAAVLLFSYYASDPRPRRAAEAMREQGMTVDVICLRENSGEAAHEVFNGVNVRRVPLSRRRGGKVSYLLQYSSFIAICFGLLAARSIRRRYHLVHVHNMPDILVFSVLIPKLLGARVILDLHDPMPELMMTIFNLGEHSRAVALLKRFERWSIRMANLVFTVNEACKRIFSSRSCSAEKVCVIMNSPDEGLFGLKSPLNGAGEKREPSKPFTVMYHGSLVERHGLDIAAEALDIVRKAIPGAQLLVYGARTPFLEGVLGSAVAKRLGNALRYLGPKRIEEVAEAILECNLGIIPNRRSIFTEINTPTRIFEYLACGKPVIAPAAPGITDYFAPDEIIFFQLGDAADLARKIEFVFHNPQAVLDIIRRGQNVYQAHRWSQERQVLIGHVTHLLQKRSRTPGRALLPSLLTRNSQ